MEIETIQTQVFTTGLFLTWYDLAGIFSILSFYFAIHIDPFKYQHKMMLMIGLSLVGINFLFYGGIIGFSSMLVVITVIFTGMYSDDKSLVRTAYPLSILMLILTAYLFINTLSCIFPIMSLIVLNASLYCFDSIKRRYMYILATILLIIYSFILGSFFAVLFELMFIYKFIKKIIKLKKLSQIYEASI